MNITCSALPEALLESELFGHERGAFTDARQQKRGLFEMADGGTVFLDEIGEMVPGLQAKLLRFLEEKTFKRVGGAADIRVDVRVVAATNRNLEDEVKHGKFREDLVLSPERAADRAAAAARARRRHPAPGALLRRHATTTSSASACAGVAPETMKRLQAYGWPGNIRELRNAIERAMLLAEGDELTDADFPLDRCGAAASAKACSCRRTASISSSSSARWSCRRSSAAAGTRRARRRCSA